MRRKVIEDFSNLLGRTYRNQLVEVPLHGAKKLNVGCGLSVAPGWLNLDASVTAWLANKSSWLHSIGYKLSGASRFYTESFYCETLRQNRFVYHNIEYGLPFRDQTIDFVYSSHFLEHLDKERARKFLAECFRVLKPSGVARIAVPDLEYAWELYRRGEKELMLHDFFFTGTDTAFSQHRYAYDFDLLSKALKGVGFPSVNRASYQRGLTPDVEILDNRAEYTLFVEAQKAHG